MSARSWHWTCGSYDSLEEAASDFSRYCSLAFEPPGAPDGAVHLIRLKLEGQAAKTSLRHRRSYREKPVGERQAERTLTALHGGGRRQSTRRTGEPRSGRRGIEEKLQAARSDGAASLHVTLIAQDLASGAADLREKELTVSPLADGETEHLLVVDLELAPGPYRCAIGIRARSSGTASYLSFDALVPADTE